MSSNPVFKPTSAQSESADGSVRLQDRAEDRLDLRALFDTYHSSIWRLLVRLGVSRTGVDDATQEVFWVAARRLDDIRIGSEHSFLYGVALRVAADERRRRKSAPSSAESGVLLEIPDRRPGPEEQVVLGQARRLLDEVLDGMTDDLRTVFVLAELEELEVREIARIEGIALGTASSRLRRAREEFSSISKRVRAAMRSEERGLRCR